jgi:hypothetical protein
VVFGGFHDSLCGVRNVRGLDKQICCAEYKISHETGSIIEIQMDSDIDREISCEIDIEVVSDRLTTRSIVRPKIGPTLISIVMSSIRSMVLSVFKLDAGFDGITDNDRL